MEEKKFRDWFTNNIFYFVIAITTCVYILKELLEIKDSGKSVAEILFDGSIFLLFGIVIIFLFRLQGIIKGYKTKEVFKAKEEKEELIEKTKDLGNEIDEYCTIKNKEELKNIRSRILASAGLSYNSCFEVDGSLIEQDFDISKIPLLSKKIKVNGKEIIKEYKDKDKIKLLLNKKKAFNKAVKVSPTPLTPNSMVSDGGKNEDRFNFGKTVIEYLSKSTSTGVIFQIIGAIIFGYYAPKLVENPTWTSLIWTSLQAIWFLLSGFGSYFMSWLYMKSDYASRLQKQNMLLREVLSEKSSKTFKEIKTEELVQKVIDKFEVE